MALELKLSTIRKMALELKLRPIREAIKISTSLRVKVLLTLGGRG